MKTRKELIEMIESTQKRAIQYYHYAEKLLEIGDYDKWELYIDMAHSKTDAVKVLLTVLGYDNMAQLRHEQERIETNEALESGEL